MQAGRIQDLKAQYKAQYAELQMVKSEMDWTQKLVEQCTHELVDDFDTWWAVLMGTHAHYCGSAVQPAAAETLLWVSCIADLLQALTALCQQGQQPHCYTCVLC